MIIKYFKPDPRVFEHKTVKKNFGVITSNRFHKLATRQSKMKRIIYNAISAKINDFPDGFYYVFIPKKTVFDKDSPGAKIKVDVKEISAEIDTFLSKMDIS